MNKKYQRYINYIVSDMEAPYFENMKEMYGLKDSEYSLVLSKLYDQPVRVKGNYVFDQNSYIIYSEDSDGYWVKYEYDQYGNRIYFERCDGHWEKREYDSNGNRIYIEDSYGHIYDYR
jgi:hypothetical protein